MKDNEVMVKKTRDLAGASELDIFQKTGAGVVEKRGVAVRDTAIGDRVVWVGIPADDPVVVPEYLFARIPDGLNDNTAVYAGAGGFIIQALRASGLTFGERVIVSGTGILGSLVSRVVPLFGAHLLEPGSAAGDVGIDALFVCPGEGQTLGMAAKLLRPKAIVVVLTQAGVDLDDIMLQEKRARMVYPGAPRPETRNVCYLGAYVRWRTKDDMELFLRLLKEGKISLEGIGG